MNFECGDSEIELKRFQMNEKLHKLMASCSTSTTWEAFASIQERYQRFMKTKTNLLVLDEIKKNLVN
jgi:hypothetical protein